MLRRFLLNCDLRAGRHLAVKHAAYIREQYLKEGAGVYTREEWSRARSLGYRGAGENSAQLDTNEGYLARMLTGHVRNLHAALRLARTFDFSGYASIYEIGCGEMLQAYVLKTIHPRLRYRATDFDPFVIEKCAGLSLLQNLEKDVVDASALTPGHLRGFQLLVSWEMIYALNDDQMLALLRAAGAAGVPFLACTTQLTGPARQLLRMVKNLNWRPGGFHYERLARSGTLRLHGWNPSVGHYARIARQAGMKLDRAWHPPAATAHLDNFSYLLFKPAPS